jgi:cell fate regulator YaaT (PSP1 superfamily)
MEFGRIVSIDKVNEIEGEMPIDGLIIRKAVSEDLKAHKKIKDLETKAFEIARERISEYGLDMKLIDAECFFDRSKIIFYFSSDNRVDFRVLLKDLVSYLKIWVELRQVNVRESSRLLGGTGICGRPLCCATFLNEFKKIDIKFALDQGLSMNSSKLCGVCGRLMCCLRYESETYAKIIEEMPKIDDIIKTPKGNAIVNGHIVILGAVKAILLENPDSFPQIFKLDEIEIINAKKI